MRARAPFDEAKATAAAQALAAAIPDEAIPAALDVDIAHADAQNQTLGNVRSRAATVLSSAAVVVTFAASVGLIANDSSADGVRFSPLVASALLGLVIAIGALTLATQWPITWTFDSGTDVFAGKSSLLDVQRAAFIRLEAAIARNSYQLDRVMGAYRWSVALLGVQAALVVLAVILS